MNRIISYTKHFFKLMGGFRFSQILIGILLVVITELNITIDNLKYSFIRRKNTSHQVKINNMYLMELNLRDNGISKDLILHKTRELFSLDFIKCFLKDSEVVFDIGANVGYYALLESCLSFKGKIFAIEPVPQNYELLKKNIMLNGFKNVTILNCAIGDKNGSDKMFIYDKCNWSSFLRNPGGKIINEIEVPILTLDAFVNNYTFPTFIRMDVEGFEYQIIMGACDLLRSNLPLKLCIELHPHLMSRENMDELLEKLRKNKFQVAAVFFESEPAHYRAINIINHLRTKLSMPNYGYIGNTYDSLYYLFKQNHGAMAFFERDFK